MVEALDGPTEERGEMHLLDHLSELRRRLLYSFIAIAVGTCIGYTFSLEVFNILNAPYHQAFAQHTLIGTGPAEAFIIRLKVSFFAGVLIVSPILFAQLWYFIAPGLYDNERKLVIPFLVTTSGLFLLGVWICYEFMLPVAYNFLAAQYESIALTPTIRLSEHVSMVVVAMLGFGIVFELPVITFVLGRFGILDHHMLIAGFRYAIVVIFIVAAVFTPPDVLSQFLMAGPLVALYGISILILKYTAKKTERE